MLLADSGVTSLTGTTGGTVLAPTGAFAAIRWNTGALGAPASQTAFSNTGLTNIAFEDLGFLGGTYGIFAGGTNNASAWYSRFKNLYFTGQTTCGLSITNYQHCQFMGNYSFGLPWGQLHQIDVASASLAPGNSTYYDLYNCNPTGSTTTAILARNISFITTATTGGAANNNEFKFDRMQSNRFGGATTTQAATMANASANITITDGTKFAVGLPVTVDATQNGFTLKKIYFVISVAANVIQLSNTYGGAAVSATGSTAVNITHTGFPCFEMIALSGSTNTNVVMDNVDVEGLSTAAMVFQNCNGGIINVSQVPSTTQASQSICCRGCANMIFNCPQSVSTDWDNSAVGNAMGFFGARFGTSVGYMGYGHWYDTVTNTFQISAGNTNDTQGAAGLNFNPSVSGGIWIPKSMGIGYVTKVVTSASYAISQLNCITTNQTSGATNTLPTASVSNVGCWYCQCNRSGGNQTINTDGTQLFNGVAGRTAVTVPTSANGWVVAVLTASGAYGWDVIPSGAMVAGAIAAAT